MPRQERNERAREIAQRIMGEKRLEEADADYARRIGAKDLQNWDGGKGVSLEKLLAVHQKTGWNLHWLIFGDGHRDAPVGDGVDGFEAGVQEALKRIGATEKELRELIAGRAAALKRAARGRKSRRVLKKTPPDQAGEE